MKLLSSITIIALFLIELNCFSQNLNNLDRLNGFKKFKLGINVSAIPNLRLENSLVKLKGVTDYTYTGNDITEFNGVPIATITLDFYNNKLYQITVHFGTPYKEYKLEQFDLVEYNLRANFGNDYHNIEESPQANILNGHIWDATNVRLESIRVDYTEKNGTSNPKYNHIYGYLLFTQKKIQQEQQAGELK